MAYVIERYFPDDTDEEREISERLIIKQYMSINAHDNYANPLTEKLSEMKICDTIKEAEEYVNMWNRYNDDFKFVEVMYDKVAKILLVKDQIGI